jgi:multidrug resistance protein, MATE family
MTQTKITPYPIGSLRELGSIAIPLMLTNLSGNLMLFLDRLILAYFSTDAMNAALTIGMACSVVLFATCAISATSEIFIGRSYGAEHFSEIGRPVWQMIWFAIATFVVFIPLGLFAENVFIPEQYKSIGTSFFQWYMFGGPLFSLVAALTSFYIGRGKVKLVTWIIILSNIINLLLAIILVLGIKNLIPAMGMKGAVFATLAAQLFQAVLLFAGFLSQKNREIYGTNRYQFDQSTFIACLQVGVPIAMGYIIELGAWAFLLRTLSTSGNEYITVFAIGQSLFILFAFFSEGMQKAVTALASNLIGANKWISMPSVLRAAVKLQLIFAAALLIPILFCSDLIIQLFISNSSLQNTSASSRILDYALLCFWLFFVFDGIKWIAASILMALKQTVSVMLVNFASVWLIAVLPIYLLVGIYRYPPLTVWIIVIIYSVLNALFLFFQYERNRKKWGNKFS